MKKEAILHIPMSHYASGFDEDTMIFRLRCARDDITSCELFYGDTACRVTPIIFTGVPMSIVASDELHDYWEIELKCPYDRLFYYFKLSDGKESTLYYGDVFTNELVDDRSEYFKLPINHRADIAKVPDWVSDAVVYNIFPDSFATAHKYISNQPTEFEYMGNKVHGKLGGTLEGAAQNVDHLKELGINCVYFNPIFAAGEYHKYDLLDYHNIDPCFGGNEAFRKTVEVFHKNGIRVIIDGVFNHCGWYFFAFDDVVKNGEQSKYKDWFYHLEFPVIRPDDPEAYPNYTCFGYERMMPKLDTANPEVREYFCEVGKYWVEKYDIDGWRLDVASEIDCKFWRAFRKTVKAAKPEALLIGEVWESADYWLGGDMFDSTMNYDLRKHARRFFAQGSIDAYAFSGRVTNMLMRYKKQMLPAQLNLLDSHDVSRFLSLCGGDKRRYKLAVLFMMCFVGMPTVFYGDELGVEGVLEKEYRAPMPWGGGDAELFRFFQKAIMLRKESEALKRGGYKTVCAKRDSMLFGLERRSENERVLVYLNCGEKSEKINADGLSLKWSEGYCRSVLSPFGFAVFS